MQFLARMSRQCLQSWSSMAPSQELNLFFRCMFFMSLMVLMHVSYESYVLYALMILVVVCVACVHMRFSWVLWFWVFSEVIMRWIARLISDQGAHLSVKSLPAHRDHAEVECAIHVVLRIRWPSRPFQFRNKEPLPISEHGRCHAIYAQELPYAIHRHLHRSQDHRIQRSCVGRGKGCGGGGGNMS